MKCARKNVTSVLVIEIGGVYRDSNSMLYGVGEMELVFADEEFKINGVSYPGFPIILTAELRSIPQVSTFLIYRCLHRGRVESKHTWASYGQALYDYLGFLNSANRDWRDVGFYELGSSPLAAYRDWSMRSGGLSESTINLRLRVICSFYNYARRQGWVETVPYDVETVKVADHSKFLAHVDVTGGYITSPDVLMKVARTAIKVLTKEQIKIFLNSINCVTQKLIARLSLSSGLRKEELLTFPSSYVFDPAKMTKGSSHFRVFCNPKDMALKGKKARGIDIPRSLMAALWQYKIHERNRLKQTSCVESGPLFLSKYGLPYSPKGQSLNHMWKLFDLPFTVTPHMLRHTYATHTLYDMRRRKSVTDPLLYLRDRLGHSSVGTTQRYLHLISIVEDDVMGEYQDYIDSTCMGVA